MAVPVFFEELFADLLKGVHDFANDTIMIALTAEANPPDAAADAILGDLTQISYSNLPARTLTVSSVAQVDGVGTVIVTDFNIEASGGSVGPFRYVVVYNDSATDDPLIAYYDIGFELTLTDTQQVAMDFNALSGMLQLQVPAP